MKIYTKKGDTGETGLIGGERVMKDDERVRTLGDLDEFNACLGLAASHSGGFSGRHLLVRVQRAVFELGAEVASPDERWSAKSLGQLTEDMERWIDDATEVLPPLTNFVLPGGTLLSAHLHQARAVCRRAERSLVAAGRERPMRDEASAFMNRASDWLFCAARLANHEGAVDDVPWSGGER